MTPPVKNVPNSWPYNLDLNNVNGVYFDAVRAIFLETFGTYRHTETFIVTGLASYLPRTPLPPPWKAKNKKYMQPTPSHKLITQQFYFWCRDCFVI